MTAQHSSSSSTAVERFETIPDVANPWRDWFAALRRPQDYPAAEVSIEEYITAACRSADKLRLSIVPRTERFTTMWRGFRQHHQNLEDSEDYRFLRWHVWRAAALRTAFDLNVRFDDDDDGKGVHIALARAMRALGPYDAEGYCDGAGNVWNPLARDRDGALLKPSSLSEYCFMVRTLVRVAVREWK